MSENKVIAAVKEACGEQCEVSRMTSFEALPLDSLEFLELMVVLEVPDSAVSMLSTVGDLIDYVAARTMA